LDCSFEANELVVIEMAASDRIRLGQQICSRMQQLGFAPYDYDKLQLGIDLPVNWPEDKDSQPTLAQLTVLAVKLKMRICIGDLNMTPLNDNS
jgi:hypothetical protein